MSNPNVLKITPDLSRSRPETYFGYAKFGQTISYLMQIPIGLTDRADGTVYHLSSSVAASGSLPAVARLMFSTTPPGGGLTIPHIYQAFDEPFLPGTNLRFFVRGGRLGYEAPDTNIHEAQRWLWTSSATPFDVRYELKQPSGFVFGAALVFETVVPF